jgi:1-acyl-sn-glycerol-3-phosphate acyltransferase
MLRFLFSTYIKWRGWKAVNPEATQVPSFIMVVAPHTSSADVWMGFAFRYYLRLDHVHFIAKKELFKPPFGWLFRNAGGVPVDRSSQHGFVDQVADMFKADPNFCVAMSPEGTRRKVDRIKTGFYHIARKADVPIVLLGLDFKNKTFRFADPYKLSENQDAELQRIIDWFAQIDGHKPELGLAHLRSS